MTQRQPPVTYPQSSLRTPDPIRRLSASELGVQVTSPPTSAGTTAQRIPENDDVLLLAQDLLADFGGVILSGPPGTSKTWYARGIALRLVDDDDSRVRFVQFHPSYQYEDFVEGYTPNPETSGFTLVDKHLVQIAHKADEVAPAKCVLVIDELSRGEPGRVFGEALTYIEKTHRDEVFSLASGSTFHIPANLLFIATMNPYDRGTDDIDIAFNRRFGTIHMDPDPTILNTILTNAGMGDDLRAKTVIFFEQLQDIARLTPQARIGHGFFVDVHDWRSLERRWDHQLKQVLERAYTLDSKSLELALQAWDQLNREVHPPATPQGAPPQISDAPTA